MKYTIIFMTNTISIYDTTLRDGSQSEEIHLSIGDKIRLTQKMDELGVRYIEGGWPGSNPTDSQYFQEIKNYHLRHATISAFGSTHSPKTSPENDQHFKQALWAGTQVVTLFGKTWDVHVRDALRISKDRNLELIYDSLAYIRAHVSELFFDAEHFFDGFKTDRDYALACLEKARQGGADILVLCDTNGGTLTTELQDIIEIVRKTFPKTQLGIHVHNDCELAVANTLQAVQCGIRHIQGTINGYGERCGNANLTTIIPILELKMQLPCLPPEHLKKLRNTSLYVSEVANLRPFIRQPFVGKAAFAHKGGVHVSAVRRNPLTYEHIVPESVGNKRRVLLSDLSGQSNILFKAKQFGIPLEKTDPAVKDVLARVKELESIGYEYAVAEASFELLLNQAIGRGKKYYTLLGFRVMDAKSTEEDAPFSEATVMIQVGGEIEHTAATGDGPVNALDNALRKGLEIFYPSLKEMTLLDFKVRVLTPNQNVCPGTASRVRVLIESGDQHDRWVTVGVSENIVEASWQALIDSINYKLFKDDKHK